MHARASSGKRNSVRRVPAAIVALALAAGFAPLAPSSAANALEPSTLGTRTEVRGTAGSVGAPTPAQSLAKLTLDQRVGQVLMMGVPATGSSASDLSILTRNKIGNVFLRGRNYGGVSAVKAVTAKAVTAKLDATAGGATGGQKRFIATDQEGGYVQALKGPGFSTMPTALHQGTWSSTTLKTAATT